MTDKQIIVDGVDVSECCAYSKHREGYCGWYTPCEGDSCSYKLEWALDKLKAKEQECEELKEKVKKYGEINKQETKDYAELKAENDLFRTCHNNEQAKRRKYGQAIEDIKEIAKKTLNMVDYKTYFKRDNKSLKQKGFKALNEILQKISEVENEYNG